MDATASDDFSYVGHRALPTLVVIGSMKAGTTALHHYLDGHPQVSMSRPKELNFFNGPACCPGGDPSRWWVEGQWHRGLGWYSRKFDPSAPARGESSPAYTSPSFPEVAARMATVLPQVRLLYIVREPFARAWSQYAHHRRDGSEVRTPEVAVLDPASQYLSRSRYVERLRPFLDHFRRGQVHVVVQERLLRHPAEEMRLVLAHIGVDPAAVDQSKLGRAVGLRATSSPRTPTALPARFREQVADDVQNLRQLLDDSLEEWSTP
jgi:hypothetical protein